MCIMCVNACLCLPNTVSVAPLGWPLGSHIISSLCCNIFMSHAAISMTCMSMSKCMHGRHADELQAERRRLGDEAAAASTAVAAARRDDRGGHQAQLFALRQVPLTWC